MQKFYFNGLENIRDMGVYVVNRIEFPNIEEVIEHEEVDGSPIGSLTVRSGKYKDSKIKMKLRIIDRHNVKEQFRNIKRWLKNVQDNRLSFDYEKCYIVKSVTLNPYSFNRISCDFECEFICQPFLKVFYSDYEEILNGEVIYNDGDIEAFPKIKLTLSSNITSVELYVNNRSVQLRDVSEYVLIDSERQQTLDINGRTIDIRRVGSVPYLDMGENEIRWSGNIEKFEILKNERYDC